MRLGAILAERGFIASGKHIPGGKERDIVSAIKTKCVVKHHTNQGVSIKPKRDTITKRTGKSLMSDEMERLNRLCKQHKLKPGEVAPLLRDPLRNLQIRGNYASIITGNE